MIVYTLQTQEKTRTVLKTSFKEDLGRATPDKMFNNVKVSFPIIVKNLTRICHERRKMVNMVVDTP